MQSTWGETLEEAADEAGRSGSMGQGLELQRLMDVAISSLPEKERVVLRCFYGLDGRPHTRQEVTSASHTHSDRQSLMSCQVSNIRIKEGRSSIAGISMILSLSSKGIAKGFIET